MAKKLSKREQELETVTYMIRYYCKHKHKHRELCSECQELVEYSKKRIGLCPFMDTKTFCSACKVHCYKKDMREQIRVVMRYSGPRMLLHRPIMALKHIYIEKKERRL